MSINNNHASIKKQLAYLVPSARGGYQVGVPDKSIPPIVGAGTRTDLYLSAPSWADLGSFKHAVETCQSLMNTWASDVTAKQNKRLEEILAQANTCIAEARESKLALQYLVLAWLAHQGEIMQAQMGQVEACFEVKERMIAENFDIVFAENNQLRQRCAQLEPLESEVEDLRREVAHLREKMRRKKKANLIED